jgi:predicted transposase YdaD
MKKRYDATMRDLFDAEPAAWMEFFGVPVPDPDLASVLDSNVSTISAETDKLLRRGGPEPVILHVEFLSGRDLRYPGHACWYNAIAREKHGEPVWTVLFLLRPVADGPELTGEYEWHFPGRGRNLWFSYDVVRLWELPPDRFLAAALPLLPLAPVSNVTPEQLPAVLTAVAERLRDEADTGLKSNVWTATQLLLGLYHSEERVKEWIGEITTMILGIPGIEESSVYQGILAKGKAEGIAEGEAKGRAEGEAKGRAEGEAKGRAEGSRQNLLRQGRKKFGPPDEQVKASVAAIHDLDRLHDLIDRVLDVSSWDELLAADDSSAEDRP